MAAESGTTVICRVASFPNSITFVIVQVSPVADAIQIVQAFADLQMSLSAFFWPSHASYWQRQRAVAASQYPGMQVHGSRTD